MGRVVDKLYKDIYLVCRHYCQNTESRNFDLFKELCGEKRFLFSMRLNISSVNMKLLRQLRMRPRFTNLMIILKK